MAMGGLAATVALTFDDVPLDGPRCVAAVAHKCECQPDPVGNIVRACAGGRPALRTWQA